MTWIMKTLHRIQIIITCVNKVDLRRRIEPEDIKKLVDCMQYVSVVKATIMVCNQYLSLIRDLILDYRRIIIIIFSVFIIIGIVVLSIVIELIALNLS